MTQDLDDASAARSAGAAWLDGALRATRADTLATFDIVERALPRLGVPQREALNPPLWELGHIGWFQDFWIGRNPLRFAGAAADPHAARAAARPNDGDALYNSSLVAHATRWSLPLPDADATRADLAAQLGRTLHWLHDADVQAGDGDTALYFFRLALFHEDMHHEAALYMAQSLGLAVDDARWQPAPLADACAGLEFGAGTWRLGSGGAGFAFDNELCAHDVALPAVAIDARVTRWAEYLPFVDSGGYRQPEWWDDAGAAWLAAERAQAPRYLRRDPDHGWQQWRHGVWRALDPRLPACHLSAHEAQAWCRWAGRRLPTEAEWERAAVERPDAFHWGQVWEWTASAFAPFPGFTAHPYRDYSAPWFGSRRVLRGGSFMTQPRLRHPRYRNFFMPHRNDVPAGFRSCGA